MNELNVKEIIENLNKFDLSSAKQLYLNKEINHLTESEYSVHSLFSKNNVRLVIPSIDYFESYKQAFNNGFYDNLMKSAALNSVEQFRTHIEQLNNGLCEKNKRGITLWLVDDQERFIGRSRLKNLSYEIDNEIFQNPNCFVDGYFSYKIRPDYQRRGYGKALMSLTFLALAYLNKNEVIFGISELNKSSLNVANKLNCELVKEHVKVYLQDDYFELCSLFKKDISKLKNFLY